MDLSHGYETSQVRAHLIPRKPPGSRQGTGWPPTDAAGTYDDGIETSPPRSWNPTPSSMEAVTNASEITLQGQLREPLNPAQGTSPLNDRPQRHRRAKNSFEGPKGHAIQSTLQRHLFTWVAYFFALCFFVFTVIFAWNATGGAKADTHFLFKNPGRTILVLQICSTVTTSLFAESLIASCEMVSATKL
jgi:hypothetical protein